MSLWARNGSFGEGFRMPARGDLSAGTGAGVRVAGLRRRGGAAHALAGLGELDVLWPARPGRFRATGCQDRRRAGGQWPGLDGTAGRDGLVWRPLPGAEDWQALLRKEA